MDNDSDLQGGSGKYTIYLILDNIYSIYKPRKSTLRYIIHEYIILNNVNKISFLIRF